MKSLCCMIAVAALAFATPAHAGINDPPIIIYRASGVVDDQNAWATIVSCTNFSGVTEKLTVVVRAADSTIKANVNVNVAHFNTAVLATRDTAIFTTEANMATGPINAGVVSIAATSVHFTCTVIGLQFHTVAPLSFPLHLLRLTPIPGTQE